MDLPTEKADGHEPTSIVAPAEKIDQERQEVVPEHEWISGPRAWAILVALTVICFLMLLDTSIVSTATPKITSDFHSLPYVGWYGAAYQLGSAALQPLTGKLYANLSTKWTFVACFAIFEIGSLLCGVATSSNMLIVGRAVAGIGASGLQNGALTILAGCVPMAKRPALMGVIIGGGQLGLVGGPLFGGLLTQYASWRWCFYINLPVGGLVAAVLVFLHIPEQTTKLPASTVWRDIHNKLDLAGFALFGPAVAMLLLAVQYGGNQYAWDSSQVIGLLVGAGVTILIWLGWNFYKGEDALLPWPMLKRQKVWSNCLVMGLFASSMFLTSFWLPIYFQGIRGKSPATSGVYLLPSILSQLLAGVVAGKLVGQFGYYLPFSVGSAALTAVGYGLLSTLGVHTSSGRWIGYQILVGAGRGMGLAMPIIAAQNTVSPAQIPTVMGLVVFSQNIGGALFLSFADTIFTNSLRTLIPGDAPSVDTNAVIAAGVYSFRNVVPKNALADVVKAYAQSINRVFYMCTGLAGLCFLVAWATRWVDIRNDRREKQPSDVSAKE